ncbi:MAG TPA: Do family serine endopeptidase [Alphaproteobacteria bacterium]|nr:Do family serine endopeptidase [Alphaproteobacteria bacterium]
MFRCLAMALALMLATSGSAQTHRQVPKSVDEIELSFAQVARKAAPAVVNIYARQIERTESSPLFDDPLFRRFFGPSFGVPRQRVRNSLGSGVIVRADGLIVTNHHVVKNASEIRVVLADRREFAATIVTSDERTDLAVLRIGPQGEELPVLAFRDSDEMEVGDLVLAIGNPFGVGQTVTSGIVSALARTQIGISDLGFFIQTDAAINPGNSGGALVGMDGRLVGINTAIYSRGGGSIGIGFAIPSNIVAVVVAAAEAGDTLVLPWIGLLGQAATAELAPGLGLQRPGGVVVNRTYPGGPAERAGLKPGDVILAVNGHEVLDPASLNYRLLPLKPDEQAEFEFLRKGEVKQAKLRLALPPETPPRDQTELSGPHPFDGAIVVNLSPAVAEELAMEGSWFGVAITDVRSDGLAARIGFEPGDVILSVNDRQIDTVGALKAALAQDATSWQIRFRRDGKTETVTIR